MADESATRDDRPRGAGRVLLAITRVWLPVAIAVVGVVAIVIGGRQGRHRQPAPASSLVIAALIVWMINWMYRMSVESNRERERGGAAREYFDRHGRWPDEMSAFRLMGVVNVTPDSFSDGGRYLDAGAAIAHGLELEAEGAAILDVGGESTRPGADPVGATRSFARVVPVIEGLIADGCRRPDLDRHLEGRVAARALAAGATLVNDVTALRGDPEMAAVVAEAGAEMLPDAHARRPAHDAESTRATTTSSARSRRSSRSGWRSRSRTGSPRSGSCSTRGSGSARRWSTTSSCCGGSTSWSRSGARW